MTEDKEDQTDGEEKNVWTLGPKEGLEKANEKVTKAFRKRAQAYGINIEDLVNAFSRERDLLRKLDLMTEILSKFPDAKSETEAKNK